MPSPFTPNAIPGQNVAVSRTVLTNAQVKALPTTAVTLLAAPGAGIIIVPLYAVLRIAWTADYTNIDATATLFVRTGTNQSMGALDETIQAGVSQFLAGGGPDGTIAVMPAPAVSRALATSNLFGSSGFHDADLANKAVSLFASNGAVNDFTGGNAANTLTVTLFYLTVAF